MKKIVRKTVMQFRKRLLPTLDEITSNQIISTEIIEGKPLMVARFGAVEIKGMLYGLYPPVRPFIRQYCFHHMHNNAGFFPVDAMNITNFAKLMLDSMEKLDVLASWRPEEIFFHKELHNVCRVPISVLSSFNEDFSYLKALENKKVLIIHPYAETIVSQYVNFRTKLFKEEYIPRFKSLQVIKAIQTAGGTTAGFSTWFEALKFMENQIQSKDFDIALLGCGAYGFPLAAFIKSMGRQAIHVGGALQLFFGIKGKRWDNSGLYNEYWVRPSDRDKPKNIEKIENGCYW